MRTRARESVFKYLFAELFNTASEEFFAVVIKENQLNEQNAAFAKELLACCQKGFDKYVKTIDELAIGYNYSRIHNADKCAIILGMAELDNYQDTPKVVIIDEAVKLSAKYSTEKSTDFVNGILAQYAKDVRND